MFIECHIHENNLTQIFQEKYNTGHFIIHGVFCIIPLRRHFAYDILPGPCGILGLQMGVVMGTSK